MADTAADVRLLDPREDIKAVSPDAHRTWTGADSSKILDAVRFLSGAMPGRLWGCVPLIPGVHDPDELARIADFISSLEEPPPVRPTPYHRLGDSKYVALGRPVPRFPGSVEELSKTAAGIFRGRGLRSHLATESPW